MVEEVHDDLARALVCAQNGLDADEQGSTEDALAFYRIADKLIARVLESGGDVVSGKDLKVLQTRGSQYHRRIEVLDRLQQRGADKSKKSLSDPIPEEDTNGLFLAMPTGVVPSAPPSEVVHRAFWLMRIMEKTMRTGAYITPRLYITPDVWLESGVDINGLKYKYTGCNSILIHIQKLSQFKVEDTKTLNKELGDFLVVLRGVQVDLASKMTFIAKPQAEGKETAKPKVGNKTMVRLKNKIFKEQLGADTQTKYISVLSKLLKESLVLEEWFDHFLAQEGDLDAQVALKLRKVGEFYFSVVCAFVVRDFNQLVKRYMKKATLRMLRK